MEYPQGNRIARNTSAKISPIDKQGDCFDWEHFNISYEYINILLEIANERQKEQGTEKQESKVQTNDAKGNRLVHGVTECCVFDFGTEYKIANYCSICGKRLIRV